jgi:hypothetical protein
MPCNCLAGVAEWLATTHKPYQGHKLIQDVASDSAFFRHADELLPPLNWLNAVDTTFEMHHPLDQVSFVILPAHGIL